MRVRLTSHSHHTFASPLKSMRELSVLIIFLMVFVSGCPQQRPLEIPPPPVDRNLSSARQAFRLGEWELLKSLVPKLPGEGPFFNEAKFYQAVVIGLDDPKAAEKKLLKLQSASSPQLKRNVELYLLIFRAISGRCLITVGPLRQVYLPLGDELEQGTRKLLEETLRTCDEADLSKREALEARKQRTQLEETQAQTRSEDGSEPETQPASQQEAGSSPLQEERDGEATESHLITLTQEERRGVSPYMQMWLPLYRSEQAGQAPQRAALNLLLSELSPLLIEEREQRGEGLKIERLDVIEQSSDQASRASEETLIPAHHVAEMRSEVDALLAVTTNQQLHDEVLAAIRTQSRPLFLLSPFQLPVTTSGTPQSEQTPENQTLAVQATQVWRIYPDQELFIEKISDLVRETKSRGVGLFVPMGDRGARLVDGFKTALTGRGIQLTAHRALSQKSSWEQVAKDVREWRVDTLIFALNSPVVASTLATHLGAKGIWSVQPSQFTQELPMESENSGEDLSKRFILWPALYDQRLLDQAGRYFEGARLFTPVMKDTQAFTALNERLREEVGRPAEILDAIVFDLLTALDEGLRLAKVKQLPLKEALLKSPWLPKFVRHLDFNSTHVLQGLFSVEVREQRFTEFLLKPEAPALDGEQVTGSQPVILKEGEAVDQSSRGAQQETTSTEHPRAEEQEATTETTE